MRTTVISGAHFLTSSFEYMHDVDASVSMLITKKKVKDQMKINILRIPQISSNVRISLFLKQQRKLSGNNAVADAHNGSVYVNKRFYALVA